jgi:3-hydroxyacyl-CoA dehydrogenase / enoyl-CoA hydratase / 3-hydroxybutyryl-CoA epimerase
MGMTFDNFSFSIDADGIALLLWDMKDRSMNVITPSVMDELEQVIDTVATDATVNGCVISSSKATFSGGADLTMLQTGAAEYDRALKQHGEEAAVRHLFETSRRLSLLYRKLETGGKPWVAAINGVCLGGAFELTLACHYRVMSAADSARVGLPEINVGLFPGAGGSQRVARLMPTADALQMLFKGEQIKPLAAKSMNLVHAVVAPEKLLETAKQWIRSGGKALAPWDEKTFKLPSGKVYSPTGMMTWPAANAIYRRETYDNYPAAKTILKAVFEGLQLPMDLALRVESRYFAQILRSKEAAAMIRTLFVSKGELEKGARRPAAPATRLTTIGIIGAGFMGAGIAYVSANAGLNVVLVDKDLATAEKGKGYSAMRITEQIAKGRAKAAERDALLARITASADQQALARCDLIIEAVFEDPAVKADVIAKLSGIIGDSCIFASNTSTLPISGLARHTKNPTGFIGIHFFSPVEKMRLVEIIVGKQTGDRALAVALDFVRAIRKTPIVVNDARGFYANRCVGNYLREGHIMLAEGVPPAMIENAAKMAGMPVGPLALNDEVAIDLALKILRATRTELGDQAGIDPRQEKILVDMVEKHQRLGRKNKKGFYDYPDQGPKRLWPGLATMQENRRDPDMISVEDLKQRFLVAQANEAARTVEEGVISDPREADVGSILGFGFAPYTGGTLSFIDGMGVSKFVALCERLAERYGERFAPAKMLIEMAARSETFYGKHAASAAGEKPSRMA